MSSAIEAAAIVSATNCVINSKGANNEDVSRNGNDCPGRPGNDRIGGIIAETDGILNSATVGGTTYQQVDLVGGTLTNVVDNNKGWIVLVGEGTSLPTPPSAVLSDWNIHTGVGNTQYMEFTFDAPVMNIAGDDLFILDWGDADDKATILLTQGGSYVDASNEEGGNGAKIDNDYFKSEGYNSSSATASSSLADFNSNRYDGGTGTSSDKVYAYLFDLSDLDVAEGGSVGSIWITNNDTADPTLVAGLVPEPATMSLLGLGGLAMLRRRRRA